MRITKTSATGNKPSGRAGFTLIEVMAVLAIVGISLGMAVSYMPDDRQFYSLRAESGRLQVILRLASENAMLEGREWGLFVAEDGYRFASLDADSGQWLYAHDEPFSRHTLPDFMKLALTHSTPARLPSAKGSLQPGIVLLSSGQINAFSLDMHPADEPAGITLAGDGLSDVTVNESSHAP